MLDSPGTRFAMLVMGHILRQPWVAHPKESAVAVVMILQSPVVKVFRCLADGCFSSDSRNKRG